MAKKANFHVYFFKGRNQLLIPIHEILSIFQSKLLKHIFEVKCTNFSREIYKQKNG